MMGVLLMRKEAGRKLKQTMGREGDGIWAWVRTRGLAEEEGLREERKVGGQKTKKVSANNNQPDDRHGGEVGLRDRDASEATARERHARRTLHFASVAMQPATSCMSHVTSIARRRSCRTASIVRMPWFDAVRRRGCTN